MNALTRLSRTLAVFLSFAILNGAVTPEALAHVVARVPMTNAPVGVPVVAPHVVGSAANVLTFTAPNLGLTVAPAALTAPAVTPAAALTLPAAAQTVPVALSAPAEAPAGRSLTAVGSDASSPYDSAADAEFKAEAGAASVASTSRISRGFTALRGLFSRRAPESLTAASDAPVAGRSLTADGSGTSSPYGSVAGLSASSVLTAPNDGKGAPPAPPAAPENGAPVKAGLGMAAWAFIGALLIAQVGVEALGTAMPPLVQAVFGDFTKVAQIAIFSSIAGIVGRQLAPIVISRFGLRKTYLATEILRLASISIMLGLLVTGHMSITGMMFFYSMNGLFGGVALTAEQSIPPALLGQDELKLRRFWNREQMILEIAGIMVPIIAGSAAVAYGSTIVLAAFPVAFLAAFAILFFTLRIPGKLELMRQADREKTKNAVHDVAIERTNAGALRGGLLTVAALLAAGGALAVYSSALISAGIAFVLAAALAAFALRVGSRLKAASFSLNKTENTFGQFFARMARGAKLVWNDKTLRYTFLAFSVLMMLNPFLYSIIAPGFGRFLVGTAGMAAIAGTIVGLYSLGGLLGSLYTDRAQSKLEKEQAEGKKTPEQVTEALRASMLRMMLWTIPTLAAFATLFLPTPAFLAAIAIPYPFVEGFFIAPGSLTLFALAIIPFGFAQVAATTMLRAYFQSKVPGAQNMPDAMGFFGSASLVISTIGLQSLSLLFQNTAGMTPFVVIAGAMIPLGLFAFYLTRKLRAAGAAKPS